MLTLSPLPYFPRIKPQRRQHRRRQKKAKAVLSNRKAAQQASASLGPALIDLEEAQKAFAPGTYEKQSAALLLETARKMVAEAHAASLSGDSLSFGPAAVRQVRTEMMGKTRIPMCTIE